MHFLNILARVVIVAIVDRVWLLLLTPVLSVYPSVTRLNTFRIIQQSRVSSFLRPSSCS